MKSKAVTKQGLSEGAAVLLLATVLVKLIGALFKIPLSSNLVLGDLGFGYFSSAYDLFTPVYTLAVSGFPVAISRVVADFAAQNRFGDIKTAVKASRRILLSLGIVSAVAMLILTVPFVSLTDKTGKSIYSMLAMVPSFIFCFLASVYRGYFEGLHNMTLTAVSNVIEALGKLILGLGFAVITVRVTGNAALAAAAAICGITAGTFLSALYLYVSYKHKGITVQDKPVLVTEPYSLKEITKILITVSVPVVLSSLSGSIVSLIDAVTVRWQLSWLIGANPAVFEEIYSNAINQYSGLSGGALSTDELSTFLYGIRSKAYTLYNLVPTLTVAVGVSAIPVLTESNANGDILSVKKNTGTVLKLSAILALPAAAGFLSLGGRIMSLLYGSGASALIGGKMLRIYGITVIFSGILIPLGCVLQALGKQNKAMLNVALGVAVKVALNLTLCQVIKINIFGAVVSTFFCNLLIFVLHFAEVVKTVGALDLKNNILKPLAAAVACGVTAFGVSRFGESSVVTVASIGAAAAVYLAVLCLLKTFTEEDILSLPAGERLLKLCKKTKIVE